MIMYLNHFSKGCSQCTHLVCFIEPTRLTNRLLNDHFGPCSIKAAKVQTHRLSIWRIEVGRGHK